MPDMLGFLELWQFLVGVLLATAALLGGAIAWIGKRIRAVSSDVAREALAPHAETVGRVAAVERGLSELSDDVKVLRDDHGAIARRIARIENTMGNVATKTDVADLGKSFAEFRGSAQADIRQIGGMVHSMHEAVLRASRSDK